ncbi:SMI1/KNR4 family protein [Pelagicoccus sp. SDUM812005]|uniref:SMI1/KNR4 family protein n=1 Tax=Pelagicoccus sp. SDUM812005 TaxID=3041257 RepID=UPI00280F5787|nr:SMI1/KNR4 family protein [Pelagicoccus sp. SDUM812005]MDQ8183862.1 SMI1/KNR4 family protein [Pelagicoccus sp. SDUM812005]
MKIIERYKQAYSAVINGPQRKETVVEILTKFGVSNSSYQEWITQTGGGPIGADWFDGITELPLSQKKLKEEEWTIEGFVIGWDGSGNPIVLQDDGSVKVEDHNFDGIHTLASSFDELLEQNT